MSSSECSAADARRSLLIVGGGMVGHRLCEMLEQRDGLERFRVTMLSEESFAPYDRVHLGRHLVEETPSSLSLASEEWYRARDISLHLGDAAATIDLEGRRVSTRAGRSHSYDVLVLATGARARIPLVPGLDQDAYWPYRSRADVERIRAGLDPEKRIAVLGGGLLGLECACALAARGLEVNVLEASRSLLPKHLDATSAQTLKNLVSRTGVDIVTGFHLRSVERDASCVRLFAEDGSVVEAEILIVTAGVHPEDGLAREAGLECSPRGGIVVDDHLQTNHADVFALGDCAVHRGLAPGLVAPGYQMAEVLAARLCGEAEAEYRGCAPDVRLKVAGVEVFAMGRFDMEAKVHQHVGPEGARTLVLHNGRLVGATVVGAADALGALQQRVSAQERLSWGELRAFHRAGTLPSKKALTVLEWPDKAVVCQCARVTCGALRTALSQGANDVGSLGRATGAGTVCGSCTGLLGELAGDPVASRAPRLSGVTGWASLAALFWLGLLLWWPEVRAASSVRESAHWVESLWRSSVFRQFTGFSIVLLFSVGLLLSARKRLAWFRWGQFAGYRALHTWLGAASLVALGLHTGLRLGQNMNRVLMSVFLAACLVGAWSGIATYFEARGGSGARVARGVLSRIHVWLLWPLPALLAFHILAAYYF